MSNKPRPQDDLPYEVRMKYIIEDYRRMLDKIESLKNYTKSLEFKLSQYKETDILMKQIKQLRQVEEAHVRDKGKYKNLNRHRLYLERLLKSNNIPFKHFKTIGKYDRTQQENPTGLPQ